MRPILFVAITALSPLLAIEVAPAQPTIDATDDLADADAPVAEAETDAAFAAVERPYLAVGAARALSNLAGPTALVRLTDGLDLDATVGVVRAGGGMAGVSTTHLGVLVGVRQTLARRGEAALSVGGRAGLIDAAGSDGTNVVLEFPARVELTVTPWLRLHVEGGLAFSIAPGTEGTIEEPGTEGETTWALGAPGLAAGAGFALAL
jgi:hypothetical protein